MRITAILGSTRGKKTATESMVNYLAKELEKKQISIQKYRAHEIYKDKDRFKSLIAGLRKSELLLICSPVYVHSLPYPLTALMEQLVRETAPSFWQDKKMMTIIHNGYPEDIQRKASLAICENFAVEMGLVWQGGIGFGGTPIIDGKPLTEAGGFTKWMRRALDEMAKSIIAGEEVSRECQEYASKHFPSIPLWLLKTLMNLKIKRDARKKGLDIDAQPYL